MIALPDISLTRVDEVVDREANEYSVTTIRVVQDGERFVYTWQRDSDAPLESPGRITAWDPDRGVAKLRFDGGAIGFVLREADTNRIARYEDHFNHLAIHPDPIRTAESVTWDFLLSYFCAALGAAEDRTVVPPAVDWQFRPLEGSPVAIGCELDGGGFTSPFREDSAVYWQADVDLEPGYAVRAYCRELGGNPVVHFELDAPDVAAHVSLHLRRSQDLSSRLSVRNALRDSTRIHRVLQAFSEANGRKIR